MPSTELQELTYASSPAWHSHERQKRKRARSTVRLFKAGAEVAASRLTSNTQYGASNTQYGGVSAQSSVAYKLSSLEEVSSRHRTTFIPGLEVQPASFHTEVWRLSRSSTELASSTSEGLTSSVDGSVATFSFYRTCSTTSAASYKQRGRKCGVLCFFLSTKLASTTSKGLTSSADRSVAFCRCVYRTCLDDLSGVLQAAWTEVWRLLLSFYRLATTTSDTLLVVSRHRA